MDSRYPHPPSEALQPPGVCNSYSQSSYNASRPPHNMSANANTSTPTGGNHASSWNTAQMSFTRPTLPRPDNFQRPPMTPLHGFNQPEPPIPGFAPPPPEIHPPPGSGFPQSTCHPPPTGFHPTPGPGLPQPMHHLPPTGLHPPPSPVFPQPTRYPPTGPHPPPGPDLPQPMRHPSSTGFYPSSSSGFIPPIHHQPTNELPSFPGLGLSQPAHFAPQTGPHPPPGIGLHQPTSHPSPIRLPQPPGPGFTQSTQHAPPTAHHPSPGPGFPQRPSQKQVHPDVPGSASNFFQQKEKFVERVVRPQPEDQMTIQRRMDNKWVKQFIESKGKLIRNDPKAQYNEISISDMKNRLYSTVLLVSQLSTLCENMKLNVDNQKAWSNSFEEAVNLKQDIQSQLKLLSDHKHLEKMKTKLSNIAKRRSCRQRAKQRLQMEEQQRELQKVDKDVAIERWRMKKIHAEEEKKKEQELKVAADAVLCEVRKKLSDVKKMQNILKSLEKLRKLRKDAASRKGISTDPHSDETFNYLLEELREVAKKWSAVYSTEENVLMVMLEGEQEEERRRDLERRRQKERDKQLQKKHKVDTMLFGDDTPADPLMQPFRHYYTQAEHSLPALVQIRREWDVFLVPMDHPDGSAIPHAWVIPEAPSNQAWASALQTSECEDV